jgi:hypothetical protein
LPACRDGRTQSRNGWKKDGPTAYAIEPVHFHPHFVAGLDMLSASPSQQAKASDAEQG